MAMITAPVDAGLASWLKSDALYVKATDSDVEARWGDKAVDTTLISSICLEPAAEAEAARQLAFLGGPLARDEHVVKGLRHDLIGRLVRLRTDLDQSLGYGGDGALVFVIGAAESDTADLTTLTVLKKL